MYSESARKSFKLEQFNSSTTEKRENTKRSRIFFNGVEIFNVFVLFHCCLHSYMYKINSSTA